MKPWHTAVAHMQLESAHAGSPTATFPSEYIETVYRYGPHGVLNHRMGPVAGGFQHYAYDLPQAMRGGCEDNGQSGTAALPNGVGTKCKNHAACLLWCDLMPKCNAFTFWEEKSWCTLSSSVKMLPSDPEEGMRISGKKCKGTLGCLCNRNTVTPYSHIVMPCSTSTSITNSSPASGW